MVSYDEKISTFTLECEKEGFEIAKDEIRIFIDDINGEKSFRTKITFFYKDDHPSLPSFKMIEDMLHFKGKQIYVSINRRENERKFSLLFRFKQDDVNDISDYLSSCPEYTEENNEKIYLDIEICDCENKIFVRIVDLFIEMLDKHVTSSTYRLPLRFYNDHEHTLFSPDIVQYPRISWEFYYNLD